MVIRNPLGTAKAVVQIHHSRQAESTTGQPKTSLRGSAMKEAHEATRCAVVSVVDANKLE